MGLEIGVLGTVVATDDGRPLPLPRARERAVVAALALAHPAAVHTESLLESLWGSEGGGSAATVRSYVSRLRHVLGEGAIRSGPSGYRLGIDDDGIDAVRARRLLAEAAAATAAGDHERGAEIAAAGLSLWRGEPFSELDTAAAVDARASLARLREDGVLTRATALLHLGHPGRAADVLAPACRAAPFTEQLWALWIRALHDDGRRDEAMRRYDEIRLVLSAELGIDPGEALRHARDELLWTPPPVRMRMPIAYARRGDRAICHAVLGRSGPPVLFLHGMFLPFEMLAEEPSSAAMLDRLSAHHRVIVMDLGGLGLSDAVPPDELSFEGWGADAAAVLDHVGLGRAGIIGCGPSTAVALHLADQRPDLVDRLALTGVPLRNAWGAERLEELLIHIDGGPTPRDAVGYLAPSRTGDVAFTEWLDRGGERGARPAVAKAFFRLLFSADLSPLVGRTAQPTLVIERPEALGNGMHGEEVMSLLANGHQLVQPGIPDVLPFLGDMEGWVAAALGFLDGAAPPVPSRLMVVAVTQVADDPPVITAHDTPEQGLSVAIARLQAADHRSRGVVHAGMVAPGSPPTGPAVERALHELEAVAVGTLARTPAFDAITSA